MAELWKRLEHRPLLLQLLPGRHHQPHQRRHRVLGVRPQPAYTRFLTLTAAITPARQGCGRARWHLSSDSLGRRASEPAIGQGGHGHGACCAAAGQMDREDNGLSSPSFIPSRRASGPFRVLWALVLFTWPFALQLPPASPILLLPRVGLPLNTTSPPQEEHAPDVWGPGGARHHPLAPGWHTGPGLAAGLLLHLEGRGVDGQGTVRGPGVSVLPLIATLGSWLSKCPPDSIFFECL